MRILARPDEESFDSASFSSSRAYCESLARASSFEVSIMQPFDHEALDIPWFRDDISVITMPDRSALGFSYYIRIRHSGGRGRSQANLLGQEYFCFPPHHGPAPSSQATHCCARTQSCSSKCAACSPPSSHRSTKKSLSTLRTLKKETTMTAKANTNMLAAVCNH
jgi:hypothetical protein